ncbi:U-BOX DOMAIN-CONTAINING PROTEIN 3 [Salix viminalis]|uniref:RING-type E3 ubiquitin transferase n=2 Tax=Salix viminalis TaxID=40686 RepID=A0A6N2KQ68_SALVM|nr:U-BOX DOMAIN-CONTAINING PROTEIN 3 [Salix viminalis]
MEISSASCPINSISRFIHLVSCQTKKFMPVQKDYETMVIMLKHLKPVLDEVDDSISSDEILCRECEELDSAVNEAREFMEKWCPEMSKICSVQQSEALLKKIQSSALEICQILCRLLQGSPTTLSLTIVQHCMQELQGLKHETVTELIEEALRSLKDDVVPCTDHLLKLIETLDLTSNQELLKESVAVEKERINVHINKAEGDLYQIDQIVDLISQIRSWLLEVECRDPKSGAPIPLYFRCPLSLELMQDPVIVASGQTYDRVSIQKWLDHGLTFCPRTRQTLSHTNLIPNYTVKAMIANWWEENNVRASSHSVCNNHVLVPSHHDLLHLDSFHCRCSLHRSNSTSRSSVKVGNGFEKQMIGVSTKLSGDEFSRYNVMGTESFEHPSRGHSYIHSRSESTSSAISSIEYVPPASDEMLKLSTKHDNVNDLSGEITSECTAASPSNNIKGSSPCSSGMQFHSPETQVDMASNGGHNCSRRSSLQFSDSGSHDQTKTSRVKKLVEGLESLSNQVQTKAAEELRLLAKHDMENRIIIGHSGAIRPLLSLLSSEVKLTQEHAVTALLNLSINEENKAIIAEAGAIEPIIQVLRSGNDGAKENSAATLFSLSVLDEYKAKIGRSGAVTALVDLLGSGTLRGKKDAATTLFSLSIFHENKSRIVRAGAVKYLVELMNPVTGMADKAVALLANLSAIGEGRLAIAKAGGVPLLVEIVESGSQRGKENAVSILMQLCLSSPKFCTLVLQEGAVPPLVALSQSGTPRAKEKAQQLLSHFRGQREASAGKGRS